MATANLRVALQKCIVRKILKGDELAFHFNLDGFK